MARLLVAFVVGKRTQVSANLLLSRVAHVTDDSIPLFTSDQLTQYRTALLHVYGQWYQPIRNGDGGRFPHQRRIAPPELLSYRVPAAFLDGLSSLERLFPSFNSSHQGN